MINIALCFAVRNCEKYLADIFANIERLKILNINTYCIFVYDNCNDRSANMLEEYQNKYPENVIVRTIENTSQLRTVRIASARNTCLQILYKKLIDNDLIDIKYHIMIDGDNRCIAKWDIDLIDKYLNNFDNDDWDCISFNRRKYYDTWALMFDDFKHHCWGYGNEKDCRAVSAIMLKCINSKLENCKTNSIEVMSAFNGFAIYKTERFRGFYYDGLYSNIKKLITDDERKSTLNMLKNIYNLDIESLENHCDFIGQSCDCNFFHLSAFQAGRKIKISKFKVI
jgi:hypothetical protein